MFTFVTFILLLSAASVLGKPVEINPVVELNNFVKVSFEKCYSCQENFGDVMKTLSSPELHEKVSPRASKLAGEVLELLPIDSEQLCNKTGLGTLQNTLARVIRIDRTSFNETNRELALNHFLRDYTIETFKKCMKKLDNEFKSVRGPDRARIEGLSLRITDGFKSVDESKIEYIRVANELDKTKFTKMLRKIHCETRPLPCSLYHNEKTGKRGKINWTQIEKYLNDYLYGPCEKFLGNRQVQNVLKRVTTVSEVALQVEYYPEISLPKDSLNWAAASVACKSLKKNQMDSFIGLVSADLGDRVIRSWQ